ncbi:MAG: hypothetical protein WCX97_04935 [Candidatus Magasanikbacteria bacterium]
MLQNQAIPVSTSSPHNSARRAPNFASKKASLDSLLAETGSFSTTGLAWQDAFRTYDWKRAFPVPDMAIRQMKELLELV